MRRTALASIPVVSVALWLLVMQPGALARAQAASPMAGHDMNDRQPILAPEQLPAPIRMQGIGNSHIPIKASPEVQAWFDQGLCLYHDFWDYESMKAFEQAIRLDPNCAMCYWGVAQAVSFRDMGANYYSKRALASAVRLKNKAGEEGKLFIEALDAQAKAKQGKSPEAIAIYRKLVQKYPHDIEARIFLAEAVMDGYDDKGEPQAGRKEGISILESVIRDAPNDSAAHHYWIHAIEPGNHPEDALKSAALLASLAPTSGHMVHMPGHIYYRVGNYAEAERWFAASAAADEKYMREQHVNVDDDWNYVHNMMYAIANLVEEGKLDAANRLSDHLAAAHGKLSESLYIWSARDAMSRVSLRLPVALRLGDWNAVLTLLDEVNLPETGKTKNLRFLAAELTAYAGGMKALESGNTAAAQAASDRMDAGLWREQREQAEKADAENDKGKEEKKDAPPTQEISPDAMPDPIMKALALASMELRAGMLAGDGRLDAAKKLFATAVLAEKKLGYHEPPFYIRPASETEAAALLQAKDYDGARAAYETALAERPNSGFELYGLARVKELQGDATGARQAYEAFLKAWPAADGALPEVAHAHEILGNAASAGR